MERRSISLIVQRPATGRQSRSLNGRDSIFLWPAGSFRTNWRPNRCVALQGRPSIRMHRSECGVYCGRNQVRERRRQRCRLPPGPSPPHRSGREDGLEPLPRAGRDRGAIRPALIFALGSSRSRTGCHARSHARAFFVRCDSTPLLVSKACSSSPRKPKGLSHCLFECLIVKASSQAQNHLSVLADRYTERCRGVFDCTRDG